MTTETIRTATPTEPVGRKPFRFPLGKSFATFVLLPFCVFLAFPFVWMLLTSMREANTIFGGTFLPGSSPSSATRPRGRRSSSRCTSGTASGSPRSR